MKCPFCGFLEDKVVDSRESREGDAIRRRRECLKCERRFTSYERIDEIPYMVIKKDGRRETFDRNKVMAGLLRACEKRPVPSSKLDSIVNAVEKYVQESPERERPTSKIGEVIMRRLKELDKVAYVRFASVYLEFEDVSEFMTELKTLVRARAGRFQLFAGHRAGPIDHQQLGIVRPLVGLRRGDHDARPAATSVIRSRARRRRDTTCSSSRRPRSSCDSSRRSTRRSPSC
jgi:transcriptional repressor NrdR